MSSLRITISRLGHALRDQVGIPVSSKKQYLEVLPEVLLEQTTDKTNNNYLLVRQRLLVRLHAEQLRAPGRGQLHLRLRNSRLGNVSQGRG